MKRVKQRTYTGEAKEHGMKKQLFKSVLAAGLLAGISIAGRAQDTATTQQNTNSSVSATPADAKTIVLSGCLDRGPGADEYSLHAKTATSWALKSDSIDLNAYLDQTVTVIAMKSGDPYGTLNVIDIKIILPSCNSW